MTKRFPYDLMFVSKALIYQCYNYQRPEPTIPALIFFSFFTSPLILNIVMVKSLYAIEGIHKILNKFLNFNG